MQLFLINIIVTACLQFDTVKFYQKVINSPGREYSDYIGLMVSSPNYTGPIIIQNGYLYDCLKEEKDYSFDSYKDTIFSILKNADTLFIQEQDIESKGFKKIKPIAHLDELAKKGLESYVDKFYRERHSLVADVSEEERNAIIYQLFKWNVSSYYSDYTGFYMMWYPNTDYQNYLVCDYEGRRNYYFSMDYYMYEYQKFRTVIVTRDNLKDFLEHTKGFKNNELYLAMRECAIYKFIDITTEELKYLKYDTINFDIYGEYLKLSYKKPYLSDFIKPYFKDEILKNTINQDEKTAIILIVSEQWLVYEEDGLIKYEMPDRFKNEVQIKYD